MKRQKIVNSDPSINFRLPDELKIQILKEADFNNQTVSNFLRDHMSSFLNGELFETVVAGYENRAFINSTDFLQLIVWVYKKKGEYNYTAEDKVKQENYISTIKLIGNQLPYELVNEFDKVLLDLMKVKNEKGDFKSYTFCRTSHLFNDGFDYKKAEDYLLNFGIETSIVQV